MTLVLTSERLRLRPLVADDFDMLVEMLADPEVMRYISEKTYTEEEVAKELPTLIKRGGGGCIGIWCTIDLATEKKIGWALLLPLPIDENDTNWDLVVPDTLPDCEVEVGYVLKRAAWGKGYATEACERMLQFAFEETPLTEIVAVTDPKNSVSQRVLRKSGMIDEGTRRAYGGKAPGFRLTREQWMAQLTERD